MNTTNKDDNLKDLSGRFGMFEMEKAASRILYVTSLENRTSVSIEDMVTDQERTGFVELVYGEWLEKSIGHPYNGCFSLTERFIERVK